MDQLFLSWTISLQHVMLWGSILPAVELLSKPDSGQQGTLRRWGLESPYIPKGGFTEPVARKLEMQPPGSSAPGSPARAPGPGTEGLILSRKVTQGGGHLPVACCWHHLFWGPRARVV